MAKFIYSLAIIVVLFIGVAMLIPKSNADKPETWTVETCASLQLVTHKAGDNTPETVRVYCVNYANPPYPEGVTTAPPQALPVSDDVGKPHQTE